MASRSKRVTILAVSHILNYVIQFFTPIFLVRILDREAYGHYKEFFVYAGMISVFLNFSIKNNILYFISKNPDKEKEYISNTSTLLLLTSITGLIIVYFTRGYFLDITTFDFIIPLILYLFFFLNLDIIDYYWLAKKKSQYVLYYSFIKAFIRVIAVLMTAYLTKDVLTIIYILILLEVLKFLFILFYFLRKKLLNFRFNFPLLKEQFIYIVPLGITSILLQFNVNISKIIITANLGAGILALYAVASQNLPIVSVIRSSVADVIFPDMAAKITKDPLDALNLWSRSNIIYLFLMSPLFFILFVYSDVFIKTLFTAEYMAAVPIFQVYLFYFLKQCFEMGIPIRTLNKNKFMLIGYFLSTPLNIILLFTLYRFIGLLGPAIAYVFSEIALAFYFGFIIIKLYNIKLSQLFFWRKVFTILGTGIALSPLLILSRYLPLNEIVTAVLFSIIYLFVYTLILRRFNFIEVNTIINKILLKLKFQK